MIVIRRMLYIILGNRYRIYIFNFEKKYIRLKNVEAFILRIIYGLRNLKIIMNYPIRNLKVDFERFRYI